MKQRLTLSKKIKIFRAWLKESGSYGLIEHCGICKSIKIKRNEFTEIEQSYRAVYECMNCHAVAEVIENWNLPKAHEPTEQAQAEG